MPAVSLPVRWLMEVVASTPTCSDGHGSPNERHLQNCSGNFSWMGFYGDSGDYIYSSRCSLASTSSKGNVSSVIPAAIRRYVTVEKIVN